MIGYTVAVRSSNWPTMQSLQACIDRHGWPVKLGDESQPQWTAPFGTAPSTLGIPVIFKGEQIELEAEFLILEPDQTAAFNERLASFNGPPARFEDGDRILAVIFRANLKEYQAGFYLLSTLIKCFGGYGLRGHYMHGTPIGADLLLAEAAERESRPPEPITQEDMRRFARDVLEAIRKARPSGDGSPSGS